MANGNPYDQYINVQFGTADQGTLILMTIDGAIRFCHSAEECIENNDVAGKSSWLSKAFDTVAELRKSLRPEIGGEIADQLNRTYEFICRQITLANVLGNIEPLHNALVVLESLRKTWQEVIDAQRVVPETAGITASA